MASTARLGLKQFTIDFTGGTLAVGMASTARLGLKHNA